MSASGLLLIGLVVGGCGSATDSEVRWEVPLREYVETLRIGAADHPVLALHGPRIAVAEDGKIYVMESDAVIKVFDPAGRFLRQVRRGRGAGPGEFLQPGPFRRLGDFFWIYDDGLARVTFLDDELEYVESYPVPQLSPPMRVMTGIPVSRDRLVAMVRAPARFPARGVVHEQLMLAMNRDGTDIDTLAVLPLFAGDHLTLSGEGVKISMTAPFEFRRHPEFAICPSGRLLAIVERGPAELAQGHYRVTVISTVTGDTVWTRERPVTLIPITPQLLDRVLADGPQRSPFMQRQIVDSIMKHFSYVSPASGVILDDRSRVWVAREALSYNAVTIWEVFDKEGSLAFRVERPRRPFGFSIIDDKIYSVVRDYHDVPYVVVDKPR